MLIEGLLLDQSTHDESFELDHVRGRSVLHLGKHRHGANQLTSGERYNLILWCRSSSYRSQHAHLHHDHHHHL